MSTLQADPPAPDARIRSALAGALDRYATAATKCEAHDYSSSNDAINEGNSLLTRAMARVVELTRGK